MVSGEGEVYADLTPPNEGREAVSEETRLNVITTRIANLTSQILHSETHL